MITSFKNSCLEFVPTIISILLFSMVFLALFGQPNLFSKFMIGLVILIGLLTLFFSKTHGGFGHRLFNSSLLVSLSISIGSMVNTTIFSSFNPLTTTGNFVLDKLLNNFLYAPWSKIVMCLITYLVIFAVFNFFSASRLTKTN